MKHALLVFAFSFCGFFPLPINAQTESAPARFIYDAPPVSRFDPSQEKPYSMMEREMQYMIFRNGDHTVPNHFCVAGYELASGRKEAVVIWSEQNMLLRWRGGDPEWTKERFANAISLSSSPSINMNDGTHHDGVNALVTDCHQHGRNYTIEPFTPPEED